MKTSKKIVAILLTALIVVLCAAIFAACDPKDDHEHVWQEVENTATCTAAGDIVSKCEVCGKEKREPSEALGHDLDMKNVQSVKAPTCQEEGTGKASCKRCGDTQDVILPKVPHNIKKPVLSKMKPATCTTPGSREGECDMCGQYVVVEVPALGHDFSGVSELESEASCEGKGIRKITCKRKSCDGDENGNKPAVQIIESPALGHDWQTRAIVDKEPTFDEAGSRSVHCNRCEKTKDVEVLPKLVAGQQTTYRWRIARFNGESLSIGLSNVKIAVMDENGNPVIGEDGNPVVSNSSNFNQNDATLTVALKPANYKVSVTGLPDGYTAESSYTIAPGNVYKDLVVHSSLLPLSQVTDKTSYNLGSVMHDYTFNDVYGHTTTLSKLLEENDIVLLNFFFVECGACQSEMPGLVSAYNIYKDKMAVVMLDCVPHDTKEDIINDFLKPFKVPMDWVAVQDMTPKGENSKEYNNICEKFHSTSAPQNMIIDKEGVVVYWEIGSTSEMVFRDTFKKFTSAPYVKTDSTQSEAPQQEAKTATVDLDIPRKDDRKEF